MRAGANWLQKASPSLQEKVLQVALRGHSSGAKALLRQSVTRQSQGLLFVLGHGERVRTLWAAAENSFPVLCVPPDSWLTFSPDGQWPTFQASPQSPGDASSSFFSPQTIWCSLGLRCQSRVGPTQTPTLLTPFPGCLRKHISEHKRVNALHCKYLLEGTLRVEYCVCEEGIGFEL